MVSTELVQVIQDDRDAAAALGVRLGWSADIVQLVRQGQLDYWPNVQALAKHRLRVPRF